VGQFLFIESRDPFEGRGPAKMLEFASELASGGDDVTVFLVQDAVSQLRTEECSKRLAALSRDGVHILADEFSARERGMRIDGMRTGVVMAPVETVIDLMAAGAKTLFF
jgi:predicted peroxiredoxin